MTEGLLTLRRLNRSTLARQMLLERADLSAYEAVERLAGLQAQLPNPPYIGLWTRLREFVQRDLSDLLAERRVVRATLMRATLHLNTAEDYRLLRPVMQPALGRAFRRFYHKQGERIDLEALVSATRAFVAEEPRTFPQIRDFVAALLPDEDPVMLTYAIRTHLALVQIPPAGAWNQFGSPYHLPAEDWLGSPLASEEEGLPHLVLRYLGAFGPATRQDAEAWSGRGNLRGTFEELRPHLRTFRDEEGRELFDLPEAPLPTEEVEAPPRFLPEYDNLILSHADRRRVVADEYRPSIFLPAGRVRATFLIDGSVRGTWKIERERKLATLVIEPFEPLSPAVLAGLHEEGERLLQVAAGDAGERDVRVDVS